ncbi:MAG: helix-turn-helix transcriptional regulator [Labilithrix sp.]
MHGGAYDGRALRRLLALLDRGVVTGGDVSEVAALLATTTKVDAVAFGQGTRFGAWNAQEGLPDQWIRDHDRFRHQDPIVPRIAKGAPGSWHFIDRLEQGDKEMDLYERFQTHFGDGALVRLYSPFASDLHIVLYRERKRRFDTEDEVMLKLLTPHLARGFATRRALIALAASPSETMRELRGSVGHAIISFPSGRVTWSERARQMWRERLSVGARGWGRLDRMIHIACARFHRGTIEARSQMLVAGVRADFAVVPPEGKEERRVVCFLIDERSSDPGHEPKPAEALLTERQRAVAHLLLVGFSLAEVARRLEISLETARGFRREIYQRLGVHSRAELAGLLG